MDGRKAKPTWAGEGGYSDHYGDRGGETNFGITHTTLRTAIAARVVPYMHSVRSLTRRQARAIYTALFWAPALCAELPPAIGLMLFDGCVNSGQGNAVRWLQRALGIRADGRIGPRTIARAWVSRDLQPLLLACTLRERREFLDALVRKAPSQGVNLHGWLNRLLALEAECLGMIA